MPVLHQFDYLFAFGLIFAALDAFMIGANDVANSFATSVSSRSLTLRQAACAAAIFEFLGGVLVGSRVADTIKNGIIPVEVFQGNPGVQLLAFVCALVASSTWLTIATRMSWPVSTSYSIVAAVTGVGVAVGGVHAPSWGWNGGNGLAPIFAGFIVAPAIAGAFASIVYLLVKFIVLSRRDSPRMGLLTAPFFFFTVSAVLTMSIIYKGAPSLGLTDLPKTITAAAIVGTAAVVTLLSAIFWMPYVHCTVIKKDYTIRPYHFFYGPFLWYRVPPADAGAPAARSAVPDYRIIRNEDNLPQAEPHIESPDPEKRFQPDDAHSPPSIHPRDSILSTQLEPTKDLHPIEGAWAEPKNLWIILRYKAVPAIGRVLTYGTSVDVHALQAGKGSGDSAEAKRIAEIHARAKQYPNDTEHLYSFMQVMTACTASFAHGANDLSNAIGPFSVIYQVWHSGDSAASKSPVPVWTLVFGACCLVIGLATYGYNIMRTLGNRITLMSPSRGFSMELGSAITVVLASQYGLPVSTTMCIVGATTGVSLCNGDWRATNWRAIGWIFLGWVLTVPIVATVAGCLMGIILNAPHF